MGLRASNDSTQDELYFISENVARESCRWMEEEIGSSVFALDCESEDIFDRFDGVCTLWNFYERAQSTIDDLQVTSGSDCNTLAGECQGWVETQGLQCDEAIVRANISPEC